MMTAPQAGWYPDPAGSGQRYWDGLEWRVSVPPNPQPVAQRRLWPWIVIGVVAALVVAVGLLGDWGGKSSVDDLAEQVQVSMQDTLSTDPDFSRYQMDVVEVTLIKASGNEYQGMATVQTRSGALHKVSIEVTADDESLMWQSAPGAFLFAAQEAFSHE